MKINSFIVQSINDMLSLDTIKLALITGIPLLFVWLGLGWLFWDPVTSFTAHIISWVPFSIIRANGAFIITFFIWFVAVLVSYALFIGLFSGFLLGGKKEKRFEAINFTLIFFFSVFWAAAIMYRWDFIDYEIRRFLTLLPFDTVSQGLAWLLAAYLFYNCFLISEYLVIFTFREAFIRALMEKHLGDTELTKTDISNVRTYGRLYWDIVWFFIASLLILPILFIPIANFLTVWFIWAWLYKESAFLGVCSLLCTNEEMQNFREHKGYFLLASLVSALLNFIPIISIFTPFFVMDLYFHWIIETKSVQKNNIEEILPSQEEE
ncbi:hypothetical protein NitYY0826_C1582 [Nitratiruptor sp. YY08-26]|uniref:EI24 domain-containing protein n=1 Tax=unclassified Nitratiruptor TaxID=2624044 RepID=UPI00191551FF|nr:MULTISPECIES: EI24 domain-containing protein [unclassified Nitratiruptor]BCD62699.1 hypothetical protein NitYY0813_C1580 [Nitratiruptor sp. YY08-13]BCD66635.1 hypothetical protein NitYY0826_C1582 [Nitratiruptor sp. YY08-26]